MEFTNFRYLKNFKFQVSDASIHDIIREGLAYIYTVTVLYATPFVSPSCDKKSFFAPYGGLPTQEHKFFFAPQLVNQSCPPKVKNVAMPLLFDDEQLQLLLSERRLLQHGVKLFLEVEHCSVDRLLRPISQYCIQFFFYMSNKLIGRQQLTILPQRVTKC